MVGCNLTLVIFPWIEIKAFLCANFVHGLIPLFPLFSREVLAFQSLAFGVFEFAKCWGLLIPSLLRSRLHLNLWIALQVLQRIESCVFLVLEL